MSSDTEQTVLDRVDAENRGRRARLNADARIASWSFLMGQPRPESARSRRLAHLGGVAAITTLVIYVTWRIGFTLPDQWLRTCVAAWLLIAFEAVPLSSG